MASGMGSGSHYGRARGEGLSPRGESSCRISGTAGGSLRGRRVQRARYEEHSMGTTTIRAATALAGLALALGAHAAAPAGATGLCKDGTYTETTTKKGACAGHQGLKKWYGKKGAPAAQDTKPAGDLAPTKPTQSINSTVSGDRL